MRRKCHRTVVTRTHLALLVLILGSCVGREGEPVVIPLTDDPGLELGMRLTFNDRTAWFMFDTGAGAHTLASWFVDAAGMAVDDSLVAGVQASDATGAAVDLRAVHGEIGWLPDGNSLVLESAIVADFPPEFQRAEVGGLINPQLLVREGQAASRARPASPRALTRALKRCPSTGRRAARARQSGANLHRGRYPDSEPGVRCLGGIRRREGVARTRYRCRSNISSRREPLDQRFTA
jgi:hypothetical protein